MENSEVKVIDTRYNNWSADTVWAHLIMKYEERIQAHGCGEFQNGYERLKFDRSKVQDISVLAERLAACCGWGIEAVDGLLPNRHFFELIKRKLFPIARRMRGSHEIGFAVLPDLFHDSLGHLPLLLTPEYSNFLITYANLALKYSSAPEAVEKLSRLYWYLIETGLIIQNAGERFFGAAIATSETECQSALLSSSNRTSFSFEEAFNSDYSSFEVQSRYFVITSFSQLIRITDNLEAELLRGFQSR